MKALPPTPLMAIATMWKMEKIQISPKLHSAELIEASASRTPDPQPLYIFRHGESLRESFIAQWTPLS